MIDREFGGGRVVPLLHVLIFLLTSCAYLAAAGGSTPAYRDAGDFIAAISQFGIAHPPGYPVYVLLGKGWLSGMVFGNPAYALHVFSAVCAGGAVVLLFVLGRAIQRLVVVDGIPQSRLWTASGLLGALLWAASPAVCDLARVDEPYTLAALIAAGVLGLILGSASASTTVAAFFLWGIGLAAHPTLLFMAPVLIVRLWGRRDQRLFVSASVALLGGLSLYLFLPWRAAQSPLSNWGDPSHWRNFWRVLLRADYGGLRLHPVESVFSWTPESAAQQLFSFVNAFGREWRWIGVVAGLLGIFSAVEPRWRRWRWALVLSWALTAPAFFLFANLPLDEPTTPAILQPYLLLAGVLWLPLVVLGLQSFFLRIPAPLAKFTGVVLLSWTIAGGAVQLVRHSQRDDFYAYDYGRNLLRSLPQGAVLYDPDDPTAFSIRALQATERRRQDVALLNFFRTRWGYEQIRRSFPDLLPPGEVASSQALQDLFWGYSIQRHPFFVELPQKISDRPYRSEGLVYAVGAPASKDSLATAERNLALYPLRGLRPDPDDRESDFFTRHLIGYYAAAHTNLGLDYAKAEHPEEAIAHYRAALAIDPLLASAYNNWAVAEFNRHRVRESIPLYRKAVALEPSNAGFQRNLRLAEQSF